MLVFRGVAYITWDPKYFQYAYLELSNRNSSEPSEPQKICPQYTPLKTNVTLENPKAQ